MDFRFVPSDPGCWHVVVSKQDRTTRAVGYNKCITGRRPRDENHAVRFRQSAKNRVERERRSRSEAYMTSLQGGASVGTPWLLEEDMGRRSPLSDIYLSIYLSRKKQWPLSENKMSDIFSFIELRKSLVYNRRVLALCRDLASNISQKLICH